MTDKQTWTTPEWRAEIDGWIVERLDERGIRVTGEIEQPHLQPWSTVLRAPTSDGIVYAKATMTGFKHEPRLTAALAHWRPDLMPEVLATDDERGWMITRDAGAMLRTITRVDPPNLTPWLEILPRYAEFQIETIPRVDEALSLGAFDHRLAVLPDHYALLLADEPALKIGPPYGLSDDEIARLRDLTPRLNELCEELTGFGIPETFMHQDFHDGNIFVGEDRVTLADWAECCVSHPFFTMNVTLRGTAHFANLAEDAPPILAMRDAYLEPWSRFVSGPDLLSAFDLSRRLALVSRARDWHRVVDLLTGEERQQEADAAPDILRRFLKVMDEAATA